MKLDKKYFFNIQSLQIKIFLICLFVAFSVMIISLTAVYRSAARTIENNAITYMENQLINTSEILDRYADNIMKLTLTIALNVAESNLLPTEKLNEPTLDWFLAKKDTVNFLESLVSDKEYIKMAAVLLENGMSYQSGGHLLLKDVANEKWFIEAWSQNEPKIFYEVDDRGFLFCRPVYQNGEMSALVVIEFDQEFFENLLYHNSPTETEFYTFTEDGTIINSYDKNNRQNELRHFVKNQDNNFSGYQRLDNENVLLVSHYSSITKLIMVGVISHKNLIIDALNMRNQTLIIAFFTIILTVIASFGFSSILCRDIQKLQCSMQAVEKGNLSSRANLRGNDEISQMAIVFNNMMDKIQSLLLKVQEDEREKHRLEQDILAVQIQPHFIYNAINSIKYVAGMKGEKEISHVAYSLAELIRSVLGNSHKYITLWEERTYIDGYLSIQRFKHSKEFSISWDVEEHLWAYKIPKLLLQPIVENALLHGIANKEDGLIQVVAYEESGKVIFKIVDNGKGLTEDEINKLLNKEEDSSSFRKIGFKNVLQRLNLLYGEKSNLKITSLPDVFTSVELLIPKEDVLNDK